MVPNISEAVVSLLEKYKIKSIGNYSSYDIKWDHTKRGFNFSRKFLQKIVHCIKNKVAKEDENVFAKAPGEGEHVFVQAPQETWHSSFTPQANENKMMEDMHKEDIMRYFDVTVETIRHDLLGANKDRIEQHEDRIRRLEQRIGLRRA